MKYCFLFDNRIITYYGFLGKPNFHIFKAAGPFSFGNYDVLGPSGSFTGP